MRPSLSIHRNVPLDSRHLMGRSGGASHGIFENTLLLPRSRQNWQRNCHFVEAIAKMIMLLSASIIIVRSLSPVGFRLGQLRKTGFASNRAGRRNEHGAIRRHTRRSGHSSFHDEALRSSFRRSLTQGHASFPRV
jgi:hypothetical protein